MTGARVCLLVTALAFIGWIGFLAYLAFTSGTVPVTHAQPVVLSRPQFLASTLDVIADVKAEDDHPAAVVTIKSIHWSLRESPPVADGDTIRVTNLAHCSGWQGPGEYILPLDRGTGDDYQVASIPLSPGFKPSGEVALRIYPRTPQTLGQLQTIPKPDRTPSKQIPLPAWFNPG